jgi:hypothetical protein
MLIAHGIRACCQCWRPRYVAKELNERTSANKARQNGVASKRQTDVHEAVLTLRAVDRAWHACGSTDNQRVSLPKTHTLLRELLNSEIKLVMSNMLVKLTNMSYISDQQTVHRCALSLN